MPRAVHVSGPLMGLKPTTEALPGNKVLLPEAPLSLWSCKGAQPCLSLILDLTLLYASPLAWEKIPSLTPPLKYLPSLKINSLGLSIHRYNYKFPE